MFCNNNELKELPYFNENLEIILCYNNKLIELPGLNKNL